MKVRIIVSGKVQGVFYREHTKNAALELGIRGLVRNLPDGTVEILAQGNERQIRELKKWCYSGSPMARVDNVAISDAEFSESKDFDIV